MLLLLALNKAHLVMDLCLELFLFLMHFFVGFLLQLPCIMWLCIVKPKPFSLSWITNWVSFLFLILLVKLQLLCFCSVSSRKKNRIKRVQVWTFMDQSCSTSFTRKAFVLLWNTLSFFTIGSLLQNMAFRRGWHLNVANVTYYMNVKLQ